MRKLLLCALLPLAALAPKAAHADNTIRTPGDHFPYRWELEPHALLGWDALYPGNSFGLGGRFSVSIVDNGFVPNINNSVAISFGIDWLHFDGANCYDVRGYSCSANFLYFPVTMQWNFFVAQRWSVFGEPGIYIWHGFFDDCPAAPGFHCNTPSETGVRPAFYLGGRFHFGERVSLTMRLGYPTFSVGVSWFL